MEDRLDQVCLAVACCRYAVSHHGDFGLFVDGDTATLVNLGLIRLSHLGPGFGKTNVRKEK